MLKEGNFFKFIFLSKLYLPMWGSNSWPQDQERPAPPTEPARCAKEGNFFKNKTIIRMFIKKYWLFDIYSYKNINQTTRNYKSLKSTKPYSSLNKSKVKD